MAKKQLESYAKSRALSSIRFEAIEHYTEDHGITLADEPTDAYGRLPKAAASEDAREFKNLFEKGFAKWTRVPPIWRYMMAGAIGKTGMTTQLLCSNALIRERASHTMIDVISRHWKETRHYPNRRWWFVTIIGDSGNMLEYQPEMNLAAFQADALQIIKATGLHAIGATEFQAINNFPQNGHGRTIMANSHFICWTDNPLFDAACVEKRLCATSPLAHWLGAKTVKIDPIKASHRHLTWKAYYMLKAPVDGKYLTRNEETPSGWSFNRTTLRVDLVVRLMELLCQLEFPQMVLAVGDGKQLRDDWLDDLQSWHQLCLDKTLWPHDHDMADAWAWLQSRRNRSKPRHPFHLSMPSTTPSRWLRAAEGAMEQMPATRRHSKILR